jgi:hypothetical protein
MPAEQLADPVPRLEVRWALAGLDLPVLADAHAKPPADRPARPTPILGKHRREHGHGERLPPVEPTLDPFETFDDLLARGVLGCLFSPG